MNIPVCPLHKTELIPVDKYIWGCSSKLKNGKRCSHIRYTTLELKDDKGNNISYKES